MPATDDDVLKRAAAWPYDHNLAESTPERVRTIAAAEGPDFATALLYDRIVGSTEHGPFIERLDALAEGNDPLPARTVLAIAPGAFYAEFPHTGADGRL